MSVSSWNPNLWPHFGHSMRPYYDFHLTEDSAGHALHRFLAHEHEKMRELERQLNMLKTPNKETGSVSFALETNVAGYEPKELKITLEGTQLVIEGEHLDATAHQTIDRKFVHRIQLPDTINLDTIQCHIDEQGKLSISAEMAQKEKQVGRQIPIMEKKSIEK